MFEEVVCCQNTVDIYYYFSTWKIETFIYEEWLNFHENWNK